MTLKYKSLDMPQFFLSTVDFWNDFRGRFIAFNHRDHPSDPFLYHLQSIKYLLFH